MTERRARKLRVFARQIEMKLVEYDLDRIEMNQEEADEETGGIDRLDISMRPQNH